MSRGLYPFTPHYLDLGSSAGGSSGHRMHYVDEGQGDPVLMVHGNPSWSFYYRDLISQLRSSHRVIAPDHVGCGRSAKPNDDHYDYTLSTRVADLGALVDSLDLRDITLVVHDWGGMIGMAWATQNPDRIARLIVMNTAAFPLPATKNLPASLALARTPWIGALLVRGANAFSRGAVRYSVERRPMSKAVAMGYLEPYDSWAHRIAVHRFVQDIPLEENDRAYSVVRETADALDLLVGQPMLICLGLKDFVFGHQFLDEWVRRFPGAEVQRFEDCGHYILEDAGEDIIPLVRKFVDGPSEKHPDGRPGSHADPRPGSHPEGQLRSHPDGHPEPQATDSSA